MELLQLQYFCEAAENSNFSRVARKYQVPVSGISYSVKRLEQELGTQLFVRTANKIKLTPEGRLLFQETRRALEILDNVKQRIQYQDNRVGGMIKIAVLVNHNLVNEIIREFKLEYPDVQILITHNTKAMSTEIDLAISDEQKYYYYFSKFPLLTEDFVLAGRKDNPVMLGEGLDIELLRKQSFISSELGTSLRDNIDQICNDLGLIASYSIVTDDTHELIEYVEKGYGVAIVPSVDIGSRFSENVILKPLGDYTRTTCVFCVPENHRSIAVELFLNRLLGYNK